MTLIELSADDAARKIRDGEVTSENLVQACLGRIDELEPMVGAWIHLDRGSALEQARAADERHQSGLATGPLNGVPVGIKDIIDTANMPTENGTVLHSGRSPDHDATLVGLLREAGAVIPGKTVTTELAVYAPGKTANPHDIMRTPGGSSSGSAAAVASFMTPLAVGTQTNGSVIRPASFCGVFGYKPSFGRISRHGVLRQARSLDTVGVFGRSLDDLALIADVLMCFDDRDPAMTPVARPEIARIMDHEPPVEPNLAFVRTPVWDRAEEGTKDAFRELLDHMGDRVDVVDLLPVFDDAHAIHRRIMSAEIAQSFAKEYQDGADQLSDQLRALIEEGQNVSVADYEAALEQVAEFSSDLEGIFGDYDAIMTPPAPGEAPLGLESTGDASFNTIWTLCGTPAITLPMLQGADDMPLGVQLVSYKGDDARLFRTARWLLELFAD